MNFKYDHKYDDIINEQHHKSKKHLSMSLYARSSQFAPFAALTGYENLVTETARIVSERIEIDDELKKNLNIKIQFISQHIKNKPEITFTYFIPDVRKNGGAYVNTKGIIKKIDLYNQNIILEDKTKIPINEIIDISCEINTFLIQ